MKTLCLLESISRADGGIFEAECALQRELHLRLGVEVDVVGMEDRFSAEDAGRWLPLKPRVIKTRGPAAFGYSPDLLSALDPKADLLYGATLWKYPSWAALRWAGKTGNPMMVAPHGSLDPWALNHAAWKKKIAAVFFKNRQLRRASCLRALSEAEAGSFRKYGLKNPIAVIPNGVEIPQEDSTKLEKGGRKRLLFLGRIHPKKGLMNALRAFAERQKDASGTLNQECAWQFVIAGWDQIEHEAELIQLCKELGLKSAVTDSKQRSGHPKLKIKGESVVPDAEIIFSGPAFGHEKKKLLRSADAFILPSLSEGLPMSVLEAWAYGLPVVMTPECNLPEGFDAGAALRVEKGVKSIAKGLDSLFSMADPDLEKMGERGRELVRKRFTWKVIAAQMHEVYDWMLGGGSVPSSVIISARGHFFG
jgi:poly(glycerol-phosphate) alpha-glucosyltransferase